LKTVQTLEGDPVYGRDVVVMQQKVMKLGQAFEGALVVLEAVQFGDLVAAQVPD